MYRVECPTCNAKIKVTEKYFGRRISCKCGSVLRLPSQPNGAEHIHAESIQFSCNGCKRKLRVKSELAGRTAKCSCGAKFQVPIPVQFEEEAFVATAVEAFDDPLASSTPSFATPSSHWETPPAPAANPYAAPRSKVGGSNLKRQLLFPAIILLIFALFTLLSLMVSMPQQVADIQATDTTTPEGAGRMVGQIVGLLIVLGGSAFTIWGSICMMRLKNYNVAFASSIVAIVPCLSPCFVGGIPFGIWSLVLLLKPALHKMFKD